MTIAELHGKISRSGSNIDDRREDLLTSDVFGGLLYAEAWDALQAWLTEARNIGGERLGDALPAGTIRSVRMVFWPFGGSHNREPDVVLSVSYEEGERVGLCIEAKYLSAKVGVGPCEQEEGDVYDQPSGDQLADQWLQTRADVPTSYGWQGVPSSKRFVLFVTAHQAMPHGAIRDTLGRLSGTTRDAAAKGCYWQGWSALHSVLEQRRPEFANSTSGSKLILVHLYGLLERKGLRSFRGFSMAVEKSKTRWPAEGRSCFWRDSFFSFLLAEAGCRVEPPIFWRGQE